MTEQYHKLKETLAEIFQLDQADLDFGIYRIMNQKRDDINDFLNKKLLENVKDALSQSTSQDTAALKEELDNLIRTLKSAGINPEENNKVQELKAQYQATGSPEALINEVFSHLTSFFRRYYHQGDFISQRRYKKDVYAIPYEGEEVKLYWANHDQYYIKTGENFKNYSFNLPDGFKVSFVLRDASTEQNNNKTQQGKERRFKLVEEDVFSFEDEKDEAIPVTHAADAKHLKIWFTYEPQEKKPTQDDLRQAASKTIKSLLPANFRTGLLASKPTASNKDRTLLDKHLQDYMARNTFDYFIHKDLGGFLNRELDFYIKNEVLEIDDLNLDAPVSFERQLRVVKALKTIARKLIALMAQLEDFQKKLWLKKKMVLQSDYCVTLDRIPEELYPDILTNHAQIREWNFLFSISEIKKVKGRDLFSNEHTAYSEVFDSSGQLLSEAETKGIGFLKENPFLVLDTQFFPKEWKCRLLASIPCLDEQCDGLMVNSENFQALTFLSNKYKESVDYIYIDPPYNTNSTPIIYKNEYLHSSWLSLIENRNEISKKLLKNTGVKSFAIDDAEMVNLSALIERQFENYRQSRLSIIHNPKGSITRDFNRVHEYCLFLTPKEGTGYIARKTEENDKPRKMRRWGENSLRTERKLSFYPIIVRNKEIINYGEVPEDDFHPEGRNIDLGDGTIAIYPIDQDGVERRWNFGLDSIKENLNRITVLEVDGTYDLFLTHELTVPKTVWTGGRYDAGNYGNTLLINIIGKKIFDFPKSINLVQDCIELITNRKEKKLILDYFGGSGTTAHATINANRSDEGQRKYIVVEMGEYFNTVTKPRIQKVIYSEDWKDGKPLSRKGSSHCFKYLRLESYEDTLNNLNLKRNPIQQSLLSTAQFGEEYLLHYMLETESRDSLLDLERFKRPFGYTLKVTENNELREQEVDLVETFNYLIGLVVESMELIRDTVVVQGRNLAGDKILVIWRDVDQMDNVSLNEFFRKLDINTRDSEFKRIYVNGDNNLENLRTDDEQWKVVLIEEEFHRRMFE